MRVEIAFEMLDLQSGMPRMGGVNVTTVKTVAQAQKWVESEVPKRETETAIVDAVTLSEIGDFADDEGEPAKARLLGHYEPAVDEWYWLD